MKRAIIVHCWSGTPEYCWYPYVKKELEAEGFEVVVPALPGTDQPELARWLPIARAIIGTPDEETWLIGHSAGCITILRYLESLSAGETIGGAVLVAGFIDSLGYKELENFFLEPLNFAAIRKHCARFTLIHSDNDPYVPLAQGILLKEVLQAELIVKHRAGHFSGSVDEPGSCTELPEVVVAIQKYSDDQNQ